MLLPILAALALAPAVGPNINIQGAGPPSSIVTATSTAWQWIPFAPRDGRVIEIESRYGLLKTRFLAHWDPTLAAWAGTAHETHSSGGALLTTTTFMEDGPCLYWRPFTGDAKAYQPGNPSAADWHQAAKAQAHLGHLAQCTTYEPFLHDTFR